MPAFLLATLLLAQAAQLVLGDVSLALLVPAIAKDDQVNATQKFFQGAVPLVQAEPGTIQWFGVEFTDVAEPTFAIFDTFDSEDARNTHLNGKVAGALFANADTLFVEDPVVNKANVLASRVQEGDGSLTEGLAVGLRVNFTAKPDKVQDVRDFLTGALTLVEAEPATLFWYAVEFPGTCVFSIVDFFAAEAGREAHLNGKVAAALFAQADTLFTAQPDVAKFDVLSADIKDDSGMSGSSGMSEGSGSGMSEDSSMSENSGMNGGSGMSEDSNMSEDSGMNEGSMSEGSGMSEDTGMQGSYQNPSPSSGAGIDPEQFCQQLCKSLVTSFMGMKNSNSNCNTD